MNPVSPERWTLDTLVQEAAAVLAVAGVDQASGRVRETPDRRTVRYYTTLGLLDRPLDFQGRTALYGRRHLLQLVAIKRLQARGESLTRIQELMLGATEPRLAELAQLPTGEAPGSPSPERRKRFWATASGEPAEPVEPAPEAPAPPGPVTRVEVPVGEGLALLVPTRRPVEPDDLEALTAAAEPLLRLLRARRLL